MQAYLDALSHVNLAGQGKPDRTGTGTRSVFGYQYEVDISRSVPVLTTKEIHLKSVLHELLWIISGNTNIQYLKDNGVRIWNEWADEAGDLGPVYGEQWRRSRGLNGETIDQLQNAITTLRTNPDSRRIIVDSWDPAAIHLQKLPPCHCLFQFYARELTFEERHKVWISNAVFGDSKGIEGMACEETPENIRLLDAAGIPKHKLSCKLYQRSADIFLGVPFNLASYAILTYMVAHVTNMVPDRFIHSFGDLHIYNNHFDQVKEQLSRTPHPSPGLSFPRGNAIKEIDDFRYEDFEFHRYNPQPKIKASVAV